MNGNIVTTLFNGSSTLIKGACIANPPTVIPNTYGNSEEQGVTESVCTNTKREDNPVVFPLPVTLLSPG